MSSFYFTYEFGIYFTNLALHSCRDNWISGSTWWPAPWGISLRSPPSCAVCFSSRTDLFLQIRCLLVLPYTYYTSLHQPLIISYWRCCLIRQSQVRDYNECRGLSPVPPEKGVFPLDHMHLCDLEKKEYLNCLKSSRNQSEKCRQFSKKYLECRMSKNLMAKQDMSELGFGKENDDGTLQGEITERVGN